MKSKIPGILALVGFLGGCAASNASTVAAADPAVAGVASSVGLKEELVQVAISSAKSYLANKVGGGQAAAQGAAGTAQGAATTEAQNTAAATQGAATATAEQKEEAAKAGVQAAVDKAKSTGQTITEPQQSGLISAIKNLL